MTPSASHRPAPVVLFAFNRPEATARALDSLASNRGADETELIVICDAPGDASDEANASAVQSRARSATGFSSVQVLVRETHLGSAASIRAGIDQMFEAHESIIVLEDDFTTARHFLEFMNKALATYADFERVVSVCAYSPGGLQTDTETYFLPGAHCWGWGAWRRSWLESDADPRVVLDALVRSDRIYEFDMTGAEPCTLKLDYAVSQGRESWVLPWMGSAILNNRVTLYPTRSLVRNEGLLDAALPENWLEILLAPLAERCPGVATRAPEIDESALDYIRSNLMKFNYGDSPRQMMYNRLMNSLPLSLRRKFYSASVRRRLRSLAG